jgi:hypothetical protein
MSSCMFGRFCSRIRVRGAAATAPYPLGATIAAIVPLLSQSRQSIAFTVVYGSAGSHPTVVADAGTDNTAVVAAPAGNPTKRFI